MSDLAHPIFYIYNNFQNNVLIRDKVVFVYTNMNI